MTALATMRIPRILLIDDDLNLGAALEKALERSGFEPRWVRSAEQAATVLGETRFDVAVLDLRLPGVHGHALLRQLQRSHADLPVIVASGTGDIDDVIEAMRHGAYDYLRKPFHAAQLVTALERTLDRHDALVERLSDGAVTEEPTARTARRTRSGTQTVSAAPAAADEAPAPSERAPAKEEERAPAKAPSPPPGRAPNVARTTAQLAVELARGKLSLPVLDPRVPKLIDNASAQSQMSSRDVVTMIERDPGLSATILRVANSPVYRPSGRPVTELEEACVRLGNAQVFTIGAEILIGQSLRCETEPFASLLSALWRNAVVTAHVARHLAGELGLRDLEEVHVTALLHNVGELALVRLLADRDWPEPPTVEALGRELARSHERFGGSLAKAWRLPQRIVRLAASHHRRPMRPELADDRTLRHLVVGAWCVAVRAGFGYAGAEAAGAPAEHLKLVQLTGSAIDEAVRMAPRFDPQRTAHEESK